MAKGAALVRDQVAEVGRELKTGGVTLAGITATLWAVEVVDLLLGHGLVRYGVEPRSMDGLLGIFAAPFLHSGIAHVTANTIGLWTLGPLSMSRNRVDFWRVVFLATVLGGLCAWLVGAPGSTHIGFSGVVFGLLGFLMARGFFERRPWPVILSLAVAWFFGSMLLGVLPIGNAGISWQMHLGGFVGGIAAASVGAKKR